MQNKDTANKAKSNNKKQIVDNPYLKSLAIRLKEERELQKLSQSDFKDIAGKNIPKEKILYAELNIKGRKLQIEELADIAKKLNVSVDYLLGLTQSKSAVTNNGLTDTTNKVIAEWGNNSLDIFDNLIQAYSKNNGVLYNMKVYLTVSYMLNKILTETLDNIERKTQENKDLSTNEVNEINILIMYLGFAFLFKKEEYTHLLQTLVKEHLREIEYARNGCIDILQYCKDKNTKIPFENIRKVKEILKIFQKYVQRDLEDEIKISILDMKDKIIREDKYFYKIQEYLIDIQK